MSRGQHVYLLSTHFQIGTAHSSCEAVSRAADKQHLRARQVLGKEKTPFFSKVPFSSTGNYFLNLNLKHLLSGTQVPISHLTTHYQVKEQID